MQPFQRMLSIVDNIEVMLFPLPDMYISQGENGSYSHEGILAIDFIGWENGQRVYQAPMYAPCSCSCVATVSPSNNGRIFQSDTAVHTPSGLQYVTFMCFHDDNPIASVGSTFLQGQVFAHTGTAGNVTGDHTHLNTADGQYAGWHQVPPANHGCLVNSSHIYETCYVNDTVITRGLSYNWVTFSGGYDPGPGPIPPTGKKRFPWVLYARKLRTERMSIY